ncbi:TolC family protein [Aquiflexum sp. TKW24L]|uniref:TolC family protein n=1 Tax=Aquiflexum sp. TKW24L TaxID=2942212 RepID=UPI0020BF90FA|nr:TolC family protein [Aquiflexum sp. TKW24L]MCL6260246.1 TolC family protein [Aquiflexum sp. TKW24L]
MLVNTHILKLRLVLPLMVLAFSVNAQNREWELEACIDTAFVHNKNILMAKNQTDIAGLKNQEAKAQLIPKLFLQGDYRYYTDLPYQLLPQAAFGGQEGIFRPIQFGVPNNISANLSFKMPIYDPQIMGGIKVSESYEALSFLQENKSREQIYLEISNLYYNAQILKNKLAFIDKNLENSQKLQKNIQLLYEQTMIQKTELDKVVLQNQQLQTQRSQILRQYESVLNLLKFSMGIEADRDFDVPTTIHSPEEESLESKNTIDILIQESRYKIVQQELKTLHNSRIPQLSLYGNYGTTGFGFNGEPEAFLDFYRVSFVGIQLNYPLFSGTVMQKKIRAKKYELANSQLQKDFVNEQTHVLSQNARQQQEQAKQQLQTNLSQITLAESVYQRTLLQQREGIASLTEVLLADNALRDSQQQYLSAMVEYLTATLEIKKLNGTLLN